MATLPPKGVESQEGLKLVAIGVPVASFTATGRISRRVET